MSLLTPFWAKDGFDKTRPMIIYGLGTLGLSYLRALVVEKVNVIAIFDINPKYHNTFVAGIPILPPDRIKDFDRGCNVFISPVRKMYTFTIMFRELGFKGNYYYSFAPEITYIEDCISNKDRNSKIVASSMDRIDQARTHIKEQKSLKIFNAALDAYCTGAWEAYEDLAEPQINILPPELFSLGDNEVLADCGAYIGDSIEKFVSQTRQQYRYIYSFEPCEIEYLMCVRLVEYNHLQNVEVNRMAVSDVDGVLCFDDDNDSQAAHVTETGSTKVVSVKMDTFFGQENRYQPTIVKMDIEGSEIAALHGMKSIISNSMPMMAISAYHRVTDLWEVPLTIAQYQSGKGYEFFYRHHACISDCMLYARPY